MWPVPMTMQTFAVLLIGLAYGSRLGTATVALYLFEGAIGLPVLATGAGLAYFAGPTAGYLFGFVAAAAFVGRLAGRGRSEEHTSELQSLMRISYAVFCVIKQIDIWHDNSLSSGTGTNKQILILLLR